MRNPWRQKAYVYWIKAHLFTLSICLLLLIGKDDLVFPLTLRVDLPRDLGILAIMLLFVIWRFWRIGLPQERYKQIERFLNRPGAPDGEREELAQFYLKHIGQARCSLMIGKKWLMYSSRDNSFAYPRADLQRVIKGIAAEHNGEGGHETNIRLILRFADDDRYAGADRNAIGGNESEVDHLIDCIRKTCADLPVQYERSTYDVWDREYADRTFRKFWRKGK